MRRLPLLLFCCIATALAATTHDVAPKRITSLFAPVAESFDSYGATIATDGRIVAIGAPSLDSHGVNSGAVFIYRYDRSVQALELLATLTPSDAHAYDAFGSALDLTSNTIVVGAPGKNAVYVFEKPSGGWTSRQENAKLTGSDVIKRDRFGQSVAIDGSTIAVGAPKHGGTLPESGAVYLFEKGHDGWSSKPEQTVLNPPETKNGAYFGHSIALHDKHMIVSAPGSGDDDTDTGSAYLFSRITDAWSSGSHTTVLHPSDTSPKQRFGLAVAIDDAIAAVSAYRPSGGGAIYLFRTDGVNDSVTEYKRLLPSTPYIGNLFGTALSLGKEYIAVGARSSAYMAQHRSGMVYLFDRTDSHLPSHEKHCLQIHDTGIRDMFGLSVALHDDMLVVGAINVASILNGDGNVYLFVWEGYRYGMDQLSPSTVPKKLRRFY